jgi:hypothetical protein
MILMQTFQQLELFSIICRTHSSNFVELIHQILSQIINFELCHFLPIQI